MDVNVSGTVAEGFEPVRDAFVRNFTALGERGAAVTVYREGRKVVDLWGGLRDVADSPAPWERSRARRRSPPSWAGVRAGRMYGARDRVLRLGVRAGHSPRHQREAGRPQG